MLLICCYRELSVFKEKGPQDIADALLSLKHAVVHPGMNGQLSPLSPGLPPHLPQSIGSAMAPSSSLSSYPMSHQHSQLQSYGEF